jgi:protocatechuate 3,4-dioxygenase beta subunit
VASDGTQGDGDAYLPAISSDGRYVGFESIASTLVGGDTNGFVDIFVHDRGVSGAGYSISGQVTDGNGDPLSGVEVACDCWSTAMSGADGSYMLTDLITGTYTITPTALNYTFTPITRTVSVPPDATGQDFVGELIAFSISGQVLDDVGDPMAGVEIATNDGLTVTTGLDGNYLLQEVAAGSYTVTAVLEGYTFTPTTRTVSVPPDATGQDFVGELATYIIAGRVAEADGTPLPGVRIFAGDTYSATTGQQGYYGVIGVLSGTYTVTASLEGYTFEPAWRTVSVPPNAIGQYFTGEQITYAISGQVTAADSSPLAGVSISAGDGYTATTDILGTYTISDVIPGTYTLTAVLEGYTFTPTERLVSVPPDAVDQDFSGELTTYAISGRVTDTGGNPVAGVIISAGEEYSATTDSQGYYTISEVVSGTYTVTASLEGYRFEPITRTVSVPPDAVGQDFTARLEVIFNWLPMVVK